MSGLYYENLVCYDVQDSKKRTKLFDELKDIGLIHIQESVFWGRLNKAEEKAVMRAFKELLDPKGDKAFITRVSLADNLKKNSFGYGEAFLPEDKPYETI